MELLSWAAFVRGVLWTENHQRATKPMTILGFLPKIFGWPLRLPTLISPTARFRTVNGILSGPILREALHDMDVHGHTASSAACLCIVPLRFCSASICSAAFPSDSTELPVGLQRFPLALQRFPSLSLVTTEQARPPGESSSSNSDRPHEHVGPYLLRSVMQNRGTSRR